MFISSCRTFINRNASYLLSNSSVLSSNSSRSSPISDVEWIINSISLIIFVLAVLGNTAALVVMFGSRGPIRLTNNKYLVNLACADLLRACFMPFTIIARVKKNFVFGPLICKILPVVQGLSVAVDVFTLVCISVERYIAICRPLLILKLQSLRFGSLLNGLILFLIWTLGLLTAVPNIYIYNLCSLPQRGRFKCEKVNPDFFDEKVYMVALDVFYFFVPMLVMLILYTLIICKIYRNNIATKMRFQQSNHTSKTRTSSSNSSVRGNSYRQPHPTPIDYNGSNLNELKLNKDSSSFDNVGHIPSHQSSSKSKSGFTEDDYQIASSWPRHVNCNENSFKSSSMSRRRIFKDTKGSDRFNNSTRSHASTKSRRLTPPSGVYHMDRHRRKALKLLIAIIVEFFICWTPLFIYHTLGTFNKRFYRLVPSIFVDLILLFSFASLLCNPFTYYFMSKRYRTVLYAYLSYCCCIREKPKLNKKHREAQHMIEALRLHQQQNAIEYKQKLHKLKPVSPNYVLQQQKRRSNTVQ